MVECIDSGHPWSRSISISIYLSFSAFCILLSLSAWFIWPILPMDTAVALNEVSFFLGLYGIAQILAKNKQSEGGDYRFL